jgi:4-hydroxybenzoate polyprenyltransferase
VNGLSGVFSRVLRFTKIEHTVFSLPLLFAGAWLGAGREMPSWRTIGLIVLAGVGARILGMSMNRILDRKIDGKNPRTKNRELPSGQISPAFAGEIALAGLTVYLTACWLLGPTVLLLSPVPAFALIVYSLLKRFTPLCHFGIGICLALAPIGAYVATAGTVESAADILLLGAFAFFWISGFDIIYALQDIAFDRKNRVRSIPASLGSTRAQIVAGLVHGAALVTLMALIFETGGGLLAYGIWAVATGAFICGYLPFIPLPTRFFPVSAIAGIAGALVPFVGE